mgnify:CR=1 FL=1
MPRKTIQNTITNEELLKQVNPKNMRLKKDFLQYLHAMQRSDKTCAAYDNDLDIFFVYLLQNCDNKFFVDMTKRDLISFQTYLIDDNKNSPARIRRIKATLSSLSNYICNALDDEFPNYRNIVHAIESPPNTPVREKTVLSDAQCQQLLDKLVSGEKYEQACMAAAARANLCVLRYTTLMTKTSSSGAFIRRLSPLRRRGAAVTSLLSSIHWLRSLSRTWSCG